METKQIEVYVTSDGKEFNDKSAAERHERSEALWDELHRVSYSGYGAHSLDEIVDYLMEFYELKSKA